MKTTNKVCPNCASSWRHEIISAMGMSTILCFMCGETLGFQWGARVVKWKGKSTARVVRGRGYAR